MGGGGKGGGSSTTVNELPPEMRAAYSDLVKKSTGVYDSTSFNPYPGGSTNSTIDSATQALTGSMTASDPAFARAGQDIQAGTTPSYQQVGSYMNPYQGGVINATLANMQENNAQQQQGVVGNAIAKGAMGGDRVGVAQAELARQQGLAQNQTLAQLNSDNYAQALQAAQQDNSQKVQAGQAEASLGSAQGQTAAQTGLSALQAGENKYSRDYGQYQAGESYPYQKLSWLSNIITGLGSTSGGTSTTTQSGGNSGSGLFGGLLGLGAMFMSDERAKEDIEPVGKLYDGQTIYRYRYKDDPEGKVQVGLLAQDVEKGHPEAVGDMGGGLKGVDYGKATEDAAHRGVVAGHGHKAEGGVIPHMADGGDPYGDDKAQGSQATGSGMDYMQSALGSTGAIAHGGGPGMPTNKGPQQQDGAAQNKQAMQAGKDFGAALKKRLAGSPAPGANPNGASAGPASQSGNLGTDPSKLPEPPKPGEVQPGGPSGGASGVVAAPDAGKGAMPQAGGPAATDPAAAASPGANGVLPPTTPDAAAGAAGAMPDPAAAAGAAGAMPDAAVTAASALPSTGAAAASAAGAAMPAAGAGMAGMGAAGGGISSLLPSLIGMFLSKGGVVPHMAGGGEPNMGFDFGGFGGGAFDTGPYADDSGGAGPGIPSPKGSRGHGTTGGKGPGMPDPPPLPKEHEKPPTPSIATDIGAGSDLNSPDFAGGKDADVDPTAAMPEDVGMSPGGLDAGYAPAGASGVVGAAPAKPDDPTHLSPLSWTPANQASLDAANFPGGEHMMPSKKMGSTEDQRRGTGLGMDAFPQGPDRRVMNPQDAADQGGPGRFAPPITNSTDVRTLPPIVGEKEPEKPTQGVVAKPVAAPKYDYTVGPNPGGDRSNMLQLGTDGKLYPRNHVPAGADPRTPSSGVVASPPPGDSASPTPPGASGNASPGGGGGTSRYTVPAAYAPTFSGLEAKYALPVGYLGTTAGIETGGTFNPGAHNKGSGADGMFQFVPGTASEMNVNSSDWQSSADGAARLAAKNAALLKGTLNRDPTGGELYLAHQQGAGGAKALLSNPNANVVDALATVYPNRQRAMNAVISNGGSPSMTAGEFASKWTSRFDGAGGAAPRQQMVASNDSGSGFTPEQLSNMEKNGIIAPGAGGGGSGVVATGSSTVAPPGGGATVAPGSTSTMQPTSTGDKPGTFNGANATIGTSGAAPAAGVVAAPASTGDAKKDTWLDTIRDHLGGRDMLSENMRMALMSAGFGIMGGTSLNPWANIGQGAQQGIQTYLAGQGNERQNALAQSEIATRSGNLDVSRQNVGLRAVQLAQDGQRISAYVQSVDQNRYSVENSPYGIMKTDKVTGQKSLTPWSEVLGHPGQPGDPQPGATGQAPAAPGAPGAAPPGGGQGVLTPNQSAPGAPVTSTPGTDISKPVTPPASGAPAAGAGAAPAAPAPSPNALPSAPPVPGATVAPLYTPGAGQQPGMHINPMVFSPTGQEFIKESNKGTIDKYQGAAQAASDASQQLAQLEEAQKGLPTTGLLAPGANFGLRVQAANAFNTAFRSVGLPEINPDAVGRGQEMQKLTNNLGMTLARTLGSREAATVVQTAIASVPGGENSPQGFYRIVRGLQAGNQRMQDLWSYVQQYAQTNGGDTTQAESEFNKLYPPSMYAAMAVCGQPAVASLRAHPEMRDKFDQAFGPGMSRNVLGF